MTLPTADLVAAAQAYSRARWCWHDIEFIEEAIRAGTLSTLPEIAAAIDAAGVEYGLDDPYDAWGIWSGRPRPVISTPHAQ
jgi:hypothetical protein